jgi:hypothetical protein
VKLTADAFQFHFSGTGSRERPMLFSLETRKGQMMKVRELITALLQYDMDGEIMIESPCHDDDGFNWYEISQTWFHEEDDVVVVQSFANPKRQFDVDAVDKMCDHCHEREKEYRRTTDDADEGYCLECLLDHGEDKDDLIPC